MNLGGGSSTPAIIPSTVTPGAAVPLVYTAVGGGRASSFPDISNWRDPSLFATIVISVLIVDTVVLFFTRYFPDILGAPLNEWYDRFQLSAVLSDVGIIVIGFVLAQLLYGYFFAGTHGWNVGIFLAVLVGVQVLHDLFFYFAVIKPIPKGHNEMMDTMKDYAAGGGALILLGDALLMLGSAAMTMALKDQSVPTLLFAGLGAAYTVPYILSTRWKSNSAKKPEKEEPAPTPLPPPKQQLAAQPQVQIRKQSYEQQMDHRDMSFGNEQAAFRTGMPPPPFSQDMPSEPIPSTFYY
jgi:hypothetical protein